ncbi:hypothetical protein FNU79_18565 [Deinococcus detaillensis]|uniref:Uncharacterized protein n=1 Tax=Deinococcus detaillensis TaxID=2592048 RepID=A0A553UFF5_9DEIO|nr:hypothetical protein [Deinococcus detaillensis]TSA78940.1 hypothetical protein FNU79_18565 [Deinococcus detaillensis]
MLSLSLTAVLDRARVAVIQTTTTNTAPAAPASITRWQQQTRADNAARAAALPRLGVSMNRTAPPAAPRVLATYPNADTVRSGRPLKVGEAVLWNFLHRLALDLGRERGHTALPSQITFHLPAVTVAGVLGFTPRHLRRLAAGLERAGLIDQGGHAQRVGLRNLWDGSLWAVRTDTRADPPRVTAEEWQHNWRPDFEADVIGKTGAAAEMSLLLSSSAEPEMLYATAKRRAAVPGVQNAPLPSSRDMPTPAGLRDALDGLAALWHLHGSKRPRAVGRLASQIAAALCEPERRRYWAGVVWQALTAQDEGRTGGLSALAAQFDRLAADLLEGAPWKSPGAVLAARLRPSS